MSFMCHSSFVLPNLRQGSWPQLVIMKLLPTLAVWVGFLCNARLHMDLTAAKQKIMFIRNWPLYHISFLTQASEFTVKSGHEDRLNQNSNVLCSLCTRCIGKIISFYNIQQKICSSKADSWVLCKIVSHLLSKICSHSFTLKEVDLDSYHCCLRICHCTQKITLIAFMCYLFYVFVCTG